MGKDAQVTGLTMSATTSGGLEISLGELYAAAYNSGGTNTVQTSTDATAYPSTVNPAATSLSWKRSIQITDYYDKIGKLLPASSNCATEIWYVKSEEVYGSGKLVESDATVFLASKSATGQHTTTTDDTTKKTTETNGGYALAELATTYAASSATLEQTSKETEIGYYLDIPMWIRTTANKSTTSGDTTTNAGTPVYCTVSISDPENSDSSKVANTEEAETNTDLKKAVRVALIPTAEATDGTTTPYTNSNGKVSLISNSTSKLNSSAKATIFAVDGSDAETYSKAADSTSTT